MKHGWIIWLVTLLVLMLGIGYLVLEATGPADGRTPQGAIAVGTALPPIDFTSSDGRKVSTAQLKGKVVLVHFWATWSPPCVKEAPALVRLYSRYNPLGLEIIGVSLDTDSAALADFTKTEGIAWPNYFDGKGLQSEIARRFGVRKVPQTVLLNQDGTVIAVGLLDNELMAAIAGQLGSTQMAAPLAPPLPPNRAMMVQEPSLQFTWKASDPGGNWMEVVSMEPASPAFLAIGDSVYVNIRYHLETAGTVRIRVAPHAVVGEGVWVPNVGVTDKPADGNGQVRRQFKYSGPATVANIKVTMTDLQMRMLDNRSPAPTLLECVVPYKGQWLAPAEADKKGRTGPALGDKSAKDEAGTSMEIVATEPNTPATLGLGQKIRISVKYSLATDSAVRIFARPARIPGKAEKAATHPSPAYGGMKAKTGVADCWFSYNEPAQIQEMTVRMVDTASGKDILRLSYPCQATWAQKNSPPQ